MFVYFRLPAFGVAAALLISGCGRGNPTPARKNDSPPTNDAAQPKPNKDDRANKDAKNAKADFAMTAAQWAEEWKKNSDPQALRTKYEGKIIELSGEVLRVGEDAFGEFGLIFLEAPKEYFEFIRCATKDLKPWVQLSQGSKVKIRGKILDLPPSPRPRGIAWMDAPFWRDQDLYPCEVLEAGPSSALVLSPPVLVSEFRNDAKTAAQKYQDKWAHLDGEIAEYQTTENGADLFLKGEGGKNFRCRLSNWAVKQLAKCEPGQKGKLYGILKSDGAVTPTVSLAEAVLTELK